MLPKKEALLKLWEHLGSFNGNSTPTRAKPIDF